MDLESVIGLTTLFTEPATVWQMPALQGEVTLKMWNHCTRTIYMSGNPISRTSDWLPIAGTPESGGIEDV